jgi:hypothetical protein
VILVEHTEQGYNVLYASPDAEVHVELDHIWSPNATIEVYSWYDGKCAYEGVGFGVFDVSYSEYIRTLRQEINTRRNKDKQAGLIGG